MPTLERLGSITRLKNTRMPEKRFAVLWSFAVRDATCNSGAKWCAQQAALKTNLMNASSISSTSTANCAITILHAPPAAKAIAEAALLL